MKICYIAHPISGDVGANLADIRRISRIINREEPNIVPFVPYYLDCVAMDDKNGDERQRGIANDIAILKSGCVHELWLTGDRISSGMKEEIIIAALMGIPVKDMRSEYAAPILPELPEEDEDLPF